jgi:hypothetical protein
VPILHHPQQVVVWAYGADPTDPTSTNWVAFSSPEGLRQAWAFEEALVDAIRHDLDHHTWFGQDSHPPSGPAAMRVYYRKELASHLAMIRDLERLARENRVKLHRGRTARAPARAPASLDWRTMSGLSGRVVVESDARKVWHRPDGSTLVTNSRPHVTLTYWHFHSATRNPSTGRLRHPWALFSVPSRYGVPTPSDEPFHAARPPRPRAA